MHLFSSNEILLYKKENKEDVDSFNYRSYRKLGKYY